MAHLHLQNTLVASLTRVSNTEKRNKGHQNATEVSQAKNWSRDRHETRLTDSTALKQAPNGLTFHTVSKAQQQEKHLFFTVLLTVS
jgi:hypothetical protein